MAKILLVDDDELMGRVFEKTFRLAGHEIELAAGGEEGLEAIKNKLPDVVLLDMMMPKMNGMDVLGKIKSNPETKDIPVAILTNLVGEEIAKTAMSKGAVKHIVKSEVTPQELVKLTEEIVAGKTVAEVVENK